MTRWRAARSRAAQRRRSSQRLPRRRPRAAPPLRKHAARRVASRAAATWRRTWNVSSPMRAGGQRRAQAQDEGGPHVHADGPDRAATPRGQGLRAEPVQGLPRARPPHPAGVAPLQVADAGEALVPRAERDRIAPTGPQGLTPTARRPAPQDPLVQAADGLGRQPPLGGDPAHRGRLTVPGHRLLPPGRTGGLARYKGQPLSPHPTAAAAHPVDCHPQPTLPGPPGQIPDLPLGPAGHVPDGDPTAAADVGGLLGPLPHPARQRPGLLLRLAGVHPRPRQAQDACYPLLGLRLPPFRDPTSRKEVYHCLSRCPSSFQRPLPDRGRYRFW